MLKSNQRNISKNTLVYPSTFVHTAYFIKICLEENEHVIRVLCLQLLTLECLFLFLEVLLKF